MTIDDLYELTKALREKGYGANRVVLASDAEGNKFSPASDDADCGVFKKGEFKSTGKPNALCLFPE